tara:strand:- start:444 stop:2642 length:2199 start_codon:yes stop_codon:yes gene_type:complete
MAALASNEILMESMMADLDWLDFANRHKDTIDYYYDDILLEHVKIETWCRKNKKYIEHMYEGVIDLDAEPTLLNEFDMKQLGIDLGLGIATSAAGVDKINTAIKTSGGVFKNIPFLGQAIAAGGTLYYIGRAVSSYNKGDKLTMYFEMFSALLASAGFVPGVGAVLSAVGKILFAPFKFVFGALFKGVMGAASGASSAWGSFFKEAGKDSASVLSKESVGMVETGLKEVAENTPGSVSTFAKGVKKVQSIMGKFLNFFTEGAGAKLLEKFGGMGDKIIGWIQSLENFISTAAKTAEKASEIVGKTAGSAESKAVVEGFIKEAGEDIAKVGASLGEDALETAGKNMARAEATLTTATGGKVAAQETATVARTALKEFTANLDTFLKDATEAAFGGSYDDFIRLLINADEAALKTVQGEMKAVFQQYARKGGGTYIKMGEKFAGSNLAKGSVGEAMKDIAINLGGKGSPEKLFETFFKEFCETTGPRILGYGTKEGKVVLKLASHEGKGALQLTLKQFSEMFGDDAAEAVLSGTLKGPAGKEALETASKAATQNLNAAIQAEAAAKQGFEAAKGAKESLEAATKAAAKEGAETVTEETIETTAKETMKKSKGIFNFKEQWKEFSEQFSKDFSKRTFAGWEAHVALNPSGIYGMPAQAMSTTSGERIDRDAGTGADRRFTQAEKDRIGTYSGSSDKSDFISSRGLNEDITLDNLVWKSKRNSRILRSQKLIGLIN